MILILLFMLLTQKFRDFHLISFGSCAPKNRNNGISIKYGDMRKLQAFALTFCFSVPFSLFSLSPVGFWLNFLGPAVPGPSALFRISVWLSLMVFVDYFVLRVFYSLLTGF